MAIVSSIPEKKLDPDEKRVVAAGYIPTVHVSTPVNNDEGSTPKRRAKYGCSTHGPVCWFIIVVQLIFVLATLCFYNWVVIPYEHGIFPFSSDGGNARTTKTEVTPLDVETQIPRPPIILRFPTRPVDFPQTGLRNPHNPPEGQDGSPNHHLRFAGTGGQPLTNLNFHPNGGAKYPSSLGSVPPHLFMIIRKMSPVQRSSVNPMQPSVVSHNHPSIHPHLLMILHRKFVIPPANDKVNSDTLKQHYAEHQDVHQRAVLEAKQKSEKMHQELLKMNSINVQAEKRDQKLANEKHHVKKNRIE